VVTAATALSEAEGKKWTGRGRRRGAATNARRRAPWRRACAAPVAPFAQAPGCPHLSSPLRTIPLPLSGLMPVATRARLARTTPPLSPLRLYAPDTLTTRVYAAAAVRRACGPFCAPTASFMTRVLSAAVSPVTDLIRDFPVRLCRLCLLLLSRRAPYAYHRPPRANALLWHRHRFLPHTLPPAAHHTACWRAASACLHRAVG